MKSCSLNIVQRHMDDSFVEPTTFVDNRIDLYWS